jgi:dihydrofolate reductase
VTGAVTEGPPNQSKEAATVSKILVHEFITLDGVIEEPSWTMDYDFDPKMGDAINDLMSSSTALLLGRRTFEMFATAWPQRTVEEDPGAPFMNESPKYVVSSTLESASGWDNSTILGPYDAEKIAELKGEVDGNIYVSGSGQLVRAMLSDGLVDGLHLFVFPVAIGGGSGPFPDGDKTTLTLTATEAYDSGVVHLAYQAAD